MDGKLQFEPVEVGGCGLPELVFVEHTPTLMIDILSQWSCCPQDDMLLQEPPLPADYGCVAGRREDFI